MCIRSMCDSLPVHLFNSRSNGVVILQYTHSAQPLILGEQLHCGSMTGRHCFLQNTSVGLCKLTVISEYRGTVTRPSLSSVLAENFLDEKLNRPTDPGKGIEGTESVGLRIINKDGLEEYIILKS